ncbi:UNVERIFIED_CONTAM: hypothetical protein H355_011803 [Colinus virginianus]|nr:hypothetical protein H355_011803 [Colinus virginianus]
MSFTGKYELQSQENFEPFMKALGLPDDQIQKGKDIKSISEIVQNGNKFKITVTTGSKCVVNMEGNNKLVAILKGLKSVTELNGDTITHTMTMGDLTYKRISKRI